MRSIIVYAADAGSITQGNFGWARVSTIGALDEETCVMRLRDSLVADLSAGHAVALGFECPLFLPVPRHSSELGKARPGEGKHSFSACAAIAGWVELAWVLRELKQVLPLLRGTLSWYDITENTADVLLWEAFISGTDKRGTHSADAAAAAKAMSEHLSAGEPASSIRADLPLSVAGALLLWAGLSSDLNLLHRSVPVVRAFHRGE
jgi:hypothetical protein